MKMYHATNEQGFHSILESGCIKVGCDKLVYLADSLENAVKFVALRYLNEDIYVFQVDVPSNRIIETFDHSYRFFKCKSYGFSRNIPFSKITGCTKYPAPERGNT